MEEKEKSDLARITFFIDAELRKRLEIYMLENNIKYIKDLMTDLIIEKLNEK